MGESHLQNEQAITPTIIQHFNQRSGQNEYRMQTTHLSRLLGKTATDITEMPLFEYQGNHERQRTLREPTQDSAFMSGISDRYHLSSRRMHLPKEYTAKHGVLNKLIAEAGVGQMVDDRGEFSYINSITMPDA